MIENGFYEDEFEQLLKEKAGQFSMYPSKRVWHSIYNNLHPGRRWPSVAMGLLLISSLIVIGYLNTGKNSITSQINNTGYNLSDNTNDKTNRHTAGIQKNVSKLQNTVYAIPAQQKPAVEYNRAFTDVIINPVDYYTYTVVKSNRPAYLQNAALATAENATASSETLAGNTLLAAANHSNGDIIQSLGNYIKSGEIYNDVAANNRKYKTDIAKQTADKNINSAVIDAGKTSDDLTVADNAPNNKPAADDKNSELKLPAATDKKIVAAKPSAKGTLTNEEKAWMENYAMQNKPASKKWKGRLGYDVYVTPAVNYRKLSTKTSHSATPFAEADINKVISQKPGLGLEAGVGLNYTVAKKLRLKAGLQFNYTNYNIDAGETNHPVQTNILLNDPVSGFSYSAARITTISNPSSSYTSVPVTLHNKTYQVSVPIGFAYKLSSKNNVDWFAGVTVQPSYIFGGKAHIVSSDLKNYVSEPSSLRPWNLNLGFETYMNFKMGAYNFHVGPQVRYQVNSTYNKNVALVEKPYAVGLKFGLTKGF